MKKKLVFVMLGILIIAFAAVGWLIVRSHQTANTSQTSSPVATEKMAPKLSYVDMALGKMSLRDKVASLFMIHSSGTDVKRLGKFVATYKPGGFILMGDNIPTSDAALKDITATLRGSDKKLPRLVGIDEEGGTVRRLMGDTFRNALTLKNLPVDMTRDAFVKRSSLVQSVGITLNFGVIADTTSDPASFIYDRVLGTTPQAAAQRVGAAVDGSKGKTLSTLKHFPGHGETDEDSHHSIPTTPISRDAWLKRDALPFQSGINAGADVVMMGHLRYSAIDSKPASLSRKWHTILRDDLKFPGLIITDDMNMLQDSGETAYHDPVKNAVMALDAGNDMLLYVLDNAGASTTKINPQKLVDGVIKAVETGTLSQSRIDESARHIFELRLKSADPISR